MFMTSFHELLRDPISLPFSSVWLDIFPSTCHFPQDFSFCGWTRRERKMYVEFHARKIQSESLRRQLRKTCFETWKKKKSVLKLFSYYEPTWIQFQLPFCGMLVVTRFRHEKNISKFDVKIKKAFQIFF